MKNSIYPDLTAPARIQACGWMIRTLGVMLPAFALVGCLSRPPLNIQTFAFSSPVLVATNAAASNEVLGIKTLQVSPPFDERPMVYRTGEYSYERDPYAEFLASPAELLVAPVTEMLLRDGCFGSVVKAGDAVKPDLLVEIRINQLYGDIRKSENPMAILAMQVIVMDATNGMPGKVILQRNYSRQIPIKSSAPAALMGGWNQALDGIFAEVVSDLRNCRGLRAN